ncbi:hypothetical protein ADUPG1_008774 [Aduncisulcus paluster]|uniref:ATPase AAA-type core domain-containing protein n=1 Tax=Aduncisulcus paluster TaxID=2918883 RepID=A0ABQ5KUH6_9EUKA|nr:hypothetical protein ADUPG1_008774 [Aduncisulcus paluster]
MLILSFEVAKANAPSIIYIDQADYLTPPPKKKKKPKKKKGQVVEEELEEGTEKIVHGIDFPAEERYSRIHKTLLKMINDLRKDNPGVVVIGCANDLSAPSVQKTLLSTFELLIPIPLPDYQTRLAFINHYLKIIDPILVKYCSWGSLGHILPLSAYAKISDGYSCGDIKRAMDMVFSRSRLATLDEKPISAMEFADKLSTIRPQFEREKIMVDFRLGLKGGKGNVKKGKKK